LWRATEKEIEMPLEKESEHLKGEKVKYGSELQKIWTYDNSTAEI
jgi:hypothetical protein